MYQFAPWSECVERNPVLTMPTWQETNEMLNPSWRGNVLAEKQELCTNRWERMMEVQKQKDWGEQEQDMFCDTRMPLCNWCGQMTGNWCEHCHTQQPSKPKHCICTSCDDEIGMCRLCRLSLQVKRGKNVVTVRQTPDSCRQQKYACATCGKRDFEYQLCEGCMCARYCSYACQKKGWKKHKTLCQFLQTKQPLSFVYSWKLEQAMQVIYACGDEALLPPVQYAGGTA